MRVMSRFSNGPSNGFVSRTARELVASVRKVSDKSMKRSHGCIRRQESGSKRGQAVAAAPSFAVF